MSETLRVFRGILLKGSMMTCHAILVLDELMRMHSFGIK